MGFRVQDFLVTYLPNDPVAEVQCPKAFFKIDGAIDFDCACNGFCFCAPSIKFGVIRLNQWLIALAAVPPQALMIVKFVECIRTLSVDHGEAGRAFNQSELMQFDEGFTKGATVAEVATWNHNPVRDFPA